MLRFRRPTSPLHSGPRSRTHLYALAVLILAVLAPGRAYALNLYAPNCDGDQRIPTAENIPVDAHPWFYPSTSYCEERTPDAPYVCALESDGDTVPVTVEPGKQLEPGLIEEACAPPRSSIIDVVRLIPDRDLLPDTRYTLFCDEAPVVLYANFTTRASTEPSLPPPALSPPSGFVRDVCFGCDATRLLHLRFEDEHLEFFEDGGVIEVDYSDGKTLLIPKVSRISEIVLPDIQSGDLTIAFVAANGERGEPHVLTLEDIEDNSGQAPCAVSNDVGHGVLWLLLPIFATRRPRRRLNTRTLQADVPTMFQTRA